MISFELIPRDQESIKKQLEFIQSNPIFDAINIPDLIRFPIRSWEVEIPERYNFVPHIRVIDFDLKKDTLINLIKKFKLNHVLLITGEKSSSYSIPVYHSSVLDAIKLLKDKFPELLVSVAVDQYRTSLKHEINYLNDKIDAGADFVFSQPFFDISLVTYFLDYVPTENLCIGLSPVVSERSKLYWENVNNVIFPKNFQASYDWNIDFYQKVFSDINWKNIYFMPIGVDLEQYFKGL